MIMNDPKDPFHLTRKKVFLWGLTTTVIVCLLIYLFVPGEPRENLVNAPLEGPGSVSAALEGEGKAANSAVPSSPLIVNDNSKLGTPEQNYQRFCSSCHGAKGEANTPVARMMTVKPPNLITGPFKYGRDEESVKSLIMNGGGVMPGFGRELGDEHAAALARYALSLEKKDGAP